MIRFILTDIEGTTSSITFVKDVLFPYAARHLEAFLAHNAALPAVQQSLAETRQTLLAEGAAQPPTDDDLYRALLHWIETDRKHTGLKRLQGLIWQQGFEGGEFTGHLYPDVAPALQRWHNQGLRLGIYSSGSVGAQQQYFGHSDAGNLLPLFEAHFDTEIGHKREAEAYRRIAQALALPPDNILFLSDVPAELAAAREAGMAVVQLVRPGTAPDPAYPQAPDFDHVVLS